MDVERRGRTRRGEQQKRGDGKRESPPTPRGRRFRDREASGWVRPRDGHPRSGQQPRAHHVGRSPNVPSLFDDRLHLLLYLFRRHHIAQLHRLTPSFNKRRNADASSLRAFRSRA